MYLKIRLFELAKKALSLKYCILFMISPALKTSVTFLEKHYHTGTLLAFAGQQKVLAFAGRTANTLGDLLWISHFTRYPCIHKDSWIIESTDVQRAANKKPSLYEEGTVFILALSWQYLCIINTKILSAGDIRLIVLCVNPNYLNPKIKVNCWLHSLSLLSWYLWSFN